MLGGNQSALNPQGPLAVEIAGLSWFLIVVLSAAWIITMLLLGYALIQARRARRASDVVSRNVVIAWGIAVPLVVLATVLVYSVGVGNAMSVTPFKDAMTVHVTGKQWWWQVRYMKGSDVIADTANEIHIPVGTPVKIKLNSTDVIHSFWAPNLTGKMDLIPGRTNEIWLRADSAGVWRGQCAEFCGAQHAHMGFEVIAEDSKKFYEWLQWQKQTAVEPVNEMTKQGQQIFMQGPCVMCHSIRGTPAGASAGPDLTHVAGRRTLAAATIPNTRGHLGGWVVNAQGIKPGSNMPRINLEANQLEPLLTYLESLR